MRRIDNNKIMLLPAMGNNNVLYIPFREVTFIMSSRVHLADKADRIDFYFDCFFLGGLKLVNIAAKCAVTPNAVKSALKRYDKEAYKMERERRKEESKKRNHEKKYTDLARAQTRERMAAKRRQQI